MMVLPSFSGNLHHYSKYRVPKTIHGSTSTKLSPETDPTSNSNAPPPQLPSTQSITTTVNHNRYCNDNRLIQSPPSPKTIKNLSNVLFIRLKQPLTQVNRDEDEGTYDEALMAYNHPIEISFCFILKKSSTIAAHPISFNLNHKP
ncbi:hypothetical protein QVD17_05825 [Tagetes erecta]|uniref:Uncharacterized protein n=1 Tax=Tagetes erecta TaxID=13708 RepID=A0AAD8LCP8_TARER|nr:hypothetical protein QVD17_05825 [Tagetes erecta]